MRKKVVIARQSVLDLSLFGEKGLTRTCDRCLVVNYQAGRENALYCVDTLLFKNDFKKELLA